MKPSRPSASVPATSSGPSRAGRSASGDEHPVSRWITYGQARKQFRHLSFKQFSTEQGPWLRSLLHVDDIHVPPPARLKEQVVSYPAQGLG